MIKKISTNKNFNLSLKKFDEIIYKLNLIAEKIELLIQQRAVLNKEFLMRHPEMISKISSCKIKI